LSSRETGKFIAGSNKTLKGDLVTPASTGQIADFGLVEKRQLSNSQSKKYGTIPPRLKKP